MDIERFKMIDRIQSMAADNTSITCLSMLPVDALVFEGHFPGLAMLPGVLSIEMMAQAAGLLAMRSHKWEKMGYLLAVEEARFRHKLAPGNELTIEATLTHPGSGYAAYDASVATGGVIAASCKLRLKLVDYANETIRQFAQSRAVNLGVWN